VCFAPPVHDNFLCVMRNCDEVMCGECGSGSVSCSLRFLGEAVFLLPCFVLDLRRFLFWSSGQCFAAV
jgi:hypothetical protein